MTTDNEELELKERLYRALYWYYRYEYAKVIDLFESENKLTNINSTTKNSEIYIKKNIERIISTLEGVIYDE